jgi:hypothetical protein
VIVTVSLAPAVRVSLEGSSVASPAFTTDHANGVPPLLYTVTGTLVWQVTGPSALGETSTSAGIGVAVAVAVGVTVGVGDGVAVTVDVGMRVGVGVAVGAVVPVGTVVGRGGGTTVGLVTGRAGVLVAGLLGVGLGSTCWGVSVGSSVLVGVELLPAMPWGTPKPIRSVEDMSSTIRAQTNPTSKRLITLVGDLLLRGHSGGNIPRSTAYLIP